MRPSPTLRDRPCLIEFSTSGCRIMLGTIDVEARLVDLLLDDQARAEADALDVEILVDGGQFLAQRHEVLLAAEQPAEQRRTA